MGTNESVTRRGEPETDRILGVRDLNVFYDMERGQAQVIDDLSIDIYRNEIIGIVGESGSGKSMFASALLDAVPPPGQAVGEVTFYPEEDRDEVEVLGLSDDDLKRFRWENIAMVFQGAMSSFNPTMKIRGHFEETIEAHEMDLAKQMAHARRLLEDLYLNADRVFNSYPHELSGGMQQRALIALSLVLEPDILVMDEPTAALDLLMQRSITNMILNLRDEYDLTILFITHDLPLLSGLVDRLSVMYAFEIVEVGPKYEVLHNAAHPYTRALLRAVPSIDTPVDDMEPIAGRSPDPVNAPQGCSYHTRCPLSDETCETQDPPHFDVTDSHSAACFYWEDAQETIPYTIGEEGLEDQ